jgi:hypothetical protein
MPETLDFVGSDSGAIDVITAVESFMTQAPEVIFTKLHFFS